VRAGDTLALARDPTVVAVAPRLRVLGGPLTATPLADAVARGIAGVLLADRYGVVVTDLGAGPELARVAVGGVLNPADVCIVLSDGTRLGDLAAKRIEEACESRRVDALRVTNVRGDPGRVAAGLMAQLLVSVEACT
jgi:hypothetical protein